MVDVIRRQVGEIQQNYPGLSNAGDAFAIWSIAFLHRLSYDEAIECAATRGRAGTGDGGVDGVVIDESDGVVYLIQCKYAESDSASFDAEALSELDTGLSRMLSPIYASELGGDFEKKAEQVRAALSGDADLVLQVVVMGRASPSLQSAVRAASSDSSDLRLQGEFWDLQRLDSEWTERETVRDLAGQDVPLTTVGAFLEVPTPTVDGLRSYGVVVVDGRSLAEAAQMHGARLVDMNVRYQLRKTKINDAIAETAVNPAKQAQFLVLNNGLTVVCESITSREEGRIVLRNPQIVNGAQTALTLSDNLEKVPSGAVSVLTRIMVVDKSIVEGTELARTISEATNRQNPVSSADLKAHDALQIRIDSDLRKLPDNWYYERRRNSYASLSAAEKSKYLAVLTKEDVGQRYRAMIGEPAKSITAKSTIFDSTSLYGKIFDESIHVEFFVLAHQLFDFYYSLLQKPKAALRLEISADFDEEVRLLFMRARNQFAAHGTSLAYILLGRRYGALEPQRAYEVALDARNGGGVYLPLHQLVVMTLIKWAVSRQQSAIENGEPFSVKDEFERSEAFVVMCQDAKMSAQFYRTQTLDLLPG
ncbi:hypothetical protein hbim_03711 [Mycolicibacterium mageritense]|uniref:Abortive phage infection protein C-terminal domain-containing protein n=2 Tax=Mycolicibacterium mageritense TaxID=53462 RepID=A0AAI8XP90_MYCME|nr:hypothetical protein hbim_03711 [Mycolicibacterium mageritense]